MSSEVEETGSKPLKLVNCMSCGGNAFIPGELQPLGTTDCAKCGAELMMPMMLEHFELNSRIAAGGMGTVYRAADTVLKRDVAIKLMQPELADDEEGGGEEDADDEEGKTDDATRIAREQTRMKNRADRAKRTAMVVKIQTKIRTLLARRALVQKKSEKTSFLCLALERAKCNLVDTVLEYQGAKPDSFQLDVSAAPPAHPETA